MRALTTWFVRNPVAANLLMALLLIGGLLALPKLQREVIPPVDLEQIQVAVAYPGAGPAEVEDGVLVKIEEAIDGIEGIKRIVSVATDALGRVTAEVQPGYEPKQVRDEIETRVRALSTLPKGAEAPAISRLELSTPAISLTLSGQLDERALKQLGSRVRDEVVALPDVTHASLVNVRGYEISIELSEASMQRYGLSFDRVAETLRRSSLDLSGGEIRSERGEIHLRTAAQALTGAQFEQIVLIRRPDGTLVRLGDVARVVDGFVDTTREVSFDGLPAVRIEVLRVGDQDIVKVTDAVKRYAERLQERLPETVKVTVWRDASRHYHSRIDTLTSNGFSGLLLVFITLLLFLRPAISFWVCMGVVVAVMATFFTMQLMGVSLSMPSLFAFILVLGTLVDDAIVVGESVYTEQREGLSGTEAAIAGVNKVAWPVFIAVLTNVLAFVPVMFLPGAQAQLWAIVPTIVIIAYAFSLVESLCVLPSHLAALSAQESTGRFMGGLQKLQHSLAGWLENVAHKRYKPLLGAALRWRGMTIAIFVAMMVITIGVVASGRIHMEFFPAVAVDYIAADVAVEESAPPSAVRVAVDQVEAALSSLAEELRQEESLTTSPVLHVLKVIGESGIGFNREARQGSNTGQLFVELAPSETRSLKVEQFVERWQARVAELQIPYLKEVRMAFSLNAPGADLEFVLSSRDGAQLQSAVQALQQRMREYPGTYEVTDSETGARDEVRFSILPEAEALGLMASDLARQVRQGFYGEEIQRIQREDEEVRVMVRYPQQARRSPDMLNQMRVRTAEGDEVPLSRVAEMKIGKEVTRITRIDRARTITVSGRVDQRVGDTYPILRDLRENYLPTLVQQYPDVSWRLGGAREEEEQVESAMGYYTLLAVLAIYAAMAILFKSYLQPFVVLLVLPFALLGALLAHMAFGLTLSLLSVSGMVGALGVCVNDSVVLIDYINSARTRSESIYDAIRNAGAARFRPIVLTTVTTFMGLTPLLLERSAQAQVLIPMAASLAFAVLTTTIVCLFLVPTLISLVLEHEDDAHASPTLVAQAEASE